jgi:hypothetical protein
MKKFFAKIVGFLHVLFGGKLDEWIMQHVQPSIEFVEKFKGVIDSPAANLFTALFPVAEKLRTFLSDNLTKALNLLFAGTSIESESDLTNKILQATEYIRNLPKPMRAAAYAKLASLMTKLSAGDENLESVKNHSVDLLVQLQYSKMKSQLTAAEVPDVEATDETVSAPDQQEDPPPPVTPVIDPALIAQHLSDPDFVSKLSALLGALPKPETAPAG